MSLTRSVCIEQYTTSRHVLKQRVVCIERRVESLAVCMPRMDKQCSHFYDKVVSFDAERQRVRYSWTFISHCTCESFTIVRSKNTLVVAIDQQNNIHLLIII